ncbi:MAG: glycosyltransferase family 39 protein [Chitinophagales bacterium]|nr:glycosyltransferase family 39 protein [Chitinophagales bacterium]
MKKIANTIWNFLGFNYTVFALIGIGLLIRIITLIVLAHFPLASDALSYHNMALQLLHNESFSPFWPPALPYFLLFFYYIFGASEIIGRVSMLLFYIFFSFAIFGLAKKIISTKTANLTVLIFAISPTYIFYSVETYTQLPTATYLAIAAYLMVLINKKSHWAYPILLGVILAALILTRASSIVFLGLIPLYIIIKAKKPSSALIPILVSLVIVFSWIDKVHQMTGRWIMINEANSVNFFIGNNPYTPLYKTWWFGSHGKGEPGVPTAYIEMLSNIRSNPPQVQDKLFLQAALTHIISRPDLFLIRTASRIRNYLAFDSFTGSALISSYSANKLLALIVIFLEALFYCAIMVLAIRYIFDSHLTSGKFENIVLLLLLAAGYAAPYWVSFSHPTYHFPVVPLFGILASTLIESAIDSKQNKISWSLHTLGNRRYLFYIVCLAFLYIQIEWILVMWSRI